MDQTTLLHIYAYIHFYLGMKFDQNLKEMLSKKVIRRKRKKVNVKMIIYIYIWKMK